MYACSAYREKTTPVQCFHRDGAYTRVVEHNARAAIKLLLKYF